MLSNHTSVLSCRFLVVFRRYSEERNCINYNYDFTATMATALYNEVECHPYVGAGHSVLQFCCSPPRRSQHNTEASPRSAPHSGTDFNAILDMRFISFLRLYIAQLQLLIGRYISSLHIRVFGYMYVLMYVVYVRMRVCKYACVCIYYVCMYLATFKVPGPERRLYHSTFTRQKVRTSDPLQ